MSISPGCLALLGLIFVFLACFGFKICSYYCKFKTIKVFMFKGNKLVLIEFAIYYLTMITQAIYLIHRNGINPVISAVGVLIMILGSILILIGQLHLGNSWRIGIDHQNRTELVMHGIYKYCRNPIFSGVIIILIGYYLLLPTLLSTALLILSIIAIGRQIVEEEKYLIKEHQELYINYVKKTGRFIPFV